MARKINYPLIVSDFDGTLVHKDGTISNENKEKISAYIQAGGKFAISTGRLPAGILPRVRELGLTGMVCCCQGAIIMDIETGQPILEGKLPYETTLAIVEKMEELNLHIHLYDAWEYYSNRDDDGLKFYEKAVRVKAKLVTDRPMSQFVKENHFQSYKILAMVEEKDNARIIQEIKKAGFVGCEVTKSDNFLVEVINANYSKGTAVEYLANYYQIPLEKTIAIGDQHNDLPMIERAGLGIAVQNADESLKAKADYVTDRAHEEGAVAEVIEKFGFMA